MPPFIEVTRLGEVIWVSSASIALIGSHDPAGSVLTLLNEVRIVIDQSPAEVLALLEQGWKVH